VGGAKSLKSYAGEKALSSINHSTLCKIMYATRTYTIELVVLQRKNISSKRHMTVDS
jgi:hypothetical protein